ncbi:uncharacterized protein TNCV_4822141 [Trichonephila clavipes]|nr:uncharacterized protein TNCV_4822141 [Trichonephila clavipes]
MRNARVFNVLPEVYFSASENVQEFLEGIDNGLLEIPSDLSFAYLKDHLLGRAQYRYQISVSAVESSVVPAIQNRKDLETRSYTKQQRQNQEPTDFAYELLKFKSIPCHTQ